MTLTNPTGQPVYVNDFRFVQMITGVAAVDRQTLDAPGWLFVGLGCGYGQESPSAPLVPACPENFVRTIIGPGESKTYEVQIWRDLPGMRSPESGASYVASFPIHTQTTEPFSPGGNEDGPEATVRLTYLPGVGGLIGPESLGPSDNRASFRALSPLGADGERRFNTARLDGVLRGDPNTGCLWLTDDGARGTPIVLLHDTAVADFGRSPWVVRNGAEVLATDGDRVSLGGGVGPNGLQGAVPGCPVEGPPFIGYFATETYYPTPSSVMTPPSTGTR